MAFLSAEVKKALDRQAPKAVKPKFKQIAQKEFKKIKAEMIAEFLAHAVTREIMDGPSAINISGTLGGVSNLFAFIGFDAGENPIAPILSLLENTNLEFKDEVKGKEIGVGFTATLPTPEEVFAITPLPWATGRSWARGIEQGISGLGHLLRKNEGRSGAAIQSRVKVRGGKFHNTPYISAFLKKYKKRFEELK